MLKALQRVFSTAAPTLEEVSARARKLGWNVEEVAEGYRVSGVDAYGQPVSRVYDRAYVVGIHHLLANVRGQQLAVQMSLKKYGPARPDDSAEAARRQEEFEEYQFKMYSREVNKPRWMRRLAW